MHWQNVRSAKCLLAKCPGTNITGDTTECNMVGIQRSRYWEGTYWHFTHSVPVFTSDIYPGSISDEEIVRQSGMAYHGNRLLADKGFLIQDILDSYGVRVETPKKLEGIKQFSMEDAHNRNISQARVHVHQAIHRFKILRDNPYS